MGWTYTLNQSPATGADAWVTLITLLVSVGWTTPSWSDGTTVTSNGSQPTAGNLRHNYAWFILRSPADPLTGNHRSFGIQTLTAAASWAYWGAKYSSAAGFTTPGATPAIDMPYNNVDENAVIPNNTAGLGSTSHLAEGYGVTLIFSADNADRYHFVADNSGSNHWSFYMLSSTKTTTTITFGFMFDGITAAFAGTSDLDAAVVYMYAGAAAYGATSYHSGSYYAQGHMGQLLNGLPLQNFQVPSFTPCYLDGTVAWTALPVNSWSGNDPVMTPIWRTAGYNAGNKAQGVKGYSSVILFDLTSAARTNYDLLTVSATGDRIWINGSLLPWQSGTAVTL